MNWKQILNELSFRVSDGIPDLTNEQHLIKLYDVLKEHQWPVEARVELIRNLTESEEWWTKMSPEQQAQYIKDHPKSQKAQDAKEKEKSTDTDKSDKGNVEKQKPVEKDKSLSKVDEDYYNKDVQPSDEEYEKSKPQQQKLKDGESPTKLPDDIFGSPSKVPKKYIKLVERLINSRYVNQTTPPITSMIDASGAGKIQAQAAEVLSMIGPTLTDDEMKNLMDTIRKHNEKLPQQMKKLKDGTLVPYKSPRYEKGSEPILSEDWLQSVESVRGGIKSRLDATYGEGNWEVENGAWDLKGDVEAMGLSDYSRNKGFSTDMYLRVKTPDGSVLDEVSLKKDLDIFLSQPSVNGVGVWALNKEENKEFNEIKKRRAELKSSGENKKGQGKKEDDKLKKREQELKNLGMSRVPEEASPIKFNEKMRASAVKFYEGVSEDQHSKLKDLDENDDEYITKLSKITGQSKSYCQMLIKTIKTLSQ